MPLTGRRVPSRGSRRWPASRTKQRRFRAHRPALGGLRGLVHLRSILGNINVLVIPDQVAVMSAHTAFADDGSLKDAQLKSRVEAVAVELAQLLAKLHG